MMLRLRSVGNVLHYQNEVVRSAIRRSSERDGQLYASERLIAAGISFLDGVFSDFPCQQSPDVDDIIFAIFVVRNLLKCQLLQFVVAAPQNFARLIIELEKAAIQSDVGDPN